MNDTEQDIRIIDLRRRVAHLVQSLSTTDQLVERLLRRIMALTDRVGQLEEITNPTQEVTND